MNSPIATSGHEYGVLHFLANTDGPLVSIVSSQTDIGLARSQELLGLGAVYHNQSRKNLTQNTLVKTGDVVRVHTKARRFQLPEFSHEKHCVFENDDFIVVNKPSGMPVHALVDNWTEHMLAWLHNHFDTEFHITHRLDIATSGLIVVAKNKNFQAHFNKLLQSSQIKKYYRANVEGRVSVNGLLSHYMEPSPQSPKVLSTTPVNGWVECRLIIESTKIINDQMSQVIIELLTGRTHQIRAQLKEIGHPIVGDKLYGAKNSNHKNEAIELACIRLSFEPNFDFQL